MQMRPARIAGTAHPCNYLTAPDPVTGLHAQAARLKVGILRKLSSAQCKDDEIALDGIHRDRHHWREPGRSTRNISRHAGTCLHNLAIGYGQHLLTVGEIRT